jgi:hypothetical protein
VNKWRLIGTDSESLSGVAPVCPTQNDATQHTGYDGTEADPSGVYDCCPQPHIECWTEGNAVLVLAKLNHAAAQVCG